MSHLKINSKKLPFTLVKSKSQERKESCKRIIMNLVLFKKEELSSNSTLTLNDRRSQHMLDVLKVKPGDQVRIGQLNGATGYGLVLEANSSAVTLEVSLTEQAPIQAHIEMIVAISRPQILKVVLQTSAMFGVKKVIFVKADKVEKSYFQSKVLEPEMIEHYLHLGLEQGGSTFVPEVVIIPRFKDSFQHIKDFVGNRLLAHPQAVFGLSELFGNKSIDFSKPTLLAIGPEGGWQDFEVRSFEEHDFVPFHVGTQILRLEIAVSSILGQIGLLQKLSTDNTSAVYGR